MAGRGRGGKRGRGDRKNSHRDDSNRNNSGRNNSGDNQRSNNQNNRGNRRGDPRGDGNQYQRARQFEDVYNNQGDYTYTAVKRVWRDESDNNGDIVMGQNAMVSDTKDPNAERWLNQWESPGKIPRKVLNVAQVAIENDLTTNDIFELTKLREERERRSKHTLHFPNGASDVVAFGRETSCKDCQRLTELVLELIKEVEASKHPRHHRPTPVNVSRYSQSVSPAASPLQTPAAHPIFSPVKVHFDGMESQVDAFLGQTYRLLDAKDGKQLAQLYDCDLHNLSVAVVAQYTLLQEELRQRFPAGKDGELVWHCKKRIPKEALGAHGTLSESFFFFVYQYLVFVRDWVNDNGQARKRNAKDLANAAIVFLGDPTSGYLVLPFVVNISRYLFRLAFDVNENSESLSSFADTKARQEFLEQAANILQQAFTKCQAGGQSTISGHPVKPELPDKRAGLYLTANACVKLFFHAQMLRKTEQIFRSIDQHSLMLSLYPAAQRVTFLYYLGRYHFANSHFHRAVLCLQTAYDQCHRDAFKHKQSILVYLIASSIILGRYPSKELLTRREASDIAPHFSALCKLISRGDIGAFHRFLDVENDSARWFLQKRVLLQLQHRCEILVWRSLIMKTFELAGFHGEKAKIPALKVPLIRATAIWSLNRAKRTKTVTNRYVQPAVNAHPTITFGRVQPPAAQSQPQSTFSFGQSSSTPLFNFTTPTSTPNTESPYSRPSTSHSSSSSYTDPDFADLDTAIREASFDPSAGTYHSEPEPDPNHFDHVELNTDTDPDPDPDGNPSRSPTIHEVESTLHSLINQGLIRGFVTHSNPRLAVPGAERGGGWKPQGFPSVWHVIHERAGGEDGKVPGWVRAGGNHNDTFGSNAGARGSMAGRVVNLSGARPVGMS